MFAGEKCQGMRLLSFEHCATIISGTRQQIPVTSNPSGAKISVDGVEAGEAPLLLTLKKKGTHTIRIEKDGKPATILSF
ncbi:MAG: PEGA domain-containing protein [Acidobacteriota bacterium]